MLGKNLSQRKSVIPFQKEVTLNNLRKSRGMTGKRKRTQIMAFQEEGKRRGWKKQTGVFKDREKSQERYVCFTNSL